MTTRSVVHSAAARLLVLLGVAAAWHPLPAQRPPGGPPAPPPTVTSPPAGAEAAPSEAFSLAFDREDRRARTLLGMIDCARRVAQLRAAGRFGPPDSLGDRGQCLRTDSTALGVFFSLDEAGTRAERLRALDLRTGQRWTAPLDTAAAVAPVMALRDAFADGAAPFVRANRQFGPMSMRFDGDSIEVWFVPLDLLRADGPVALGGERGFVYTPDGRTRVRQLDAGVDFGAWSAPDTGRVVLVSDHEIPPLSHLLAFYVLQSRRRQVVLVSRGHTFQASGPGVMAPWLIARRASTP